MDSSAIFDWWQRSDQRIALIPCPHCGHKIFLDFFSVHGHPEWGKFVWEEDNPASIQYQCGSCQNLFSEEHLNRWELEPEWKPLQPGREVIGFHLNAFYSPWTRWSELLRKHLEAGLNPSRRMTVMNTTGGWPFSFEAMSTPQWESLQARSGGYARYEIPAEVRVLLAGCDVQMDRLEVSVFGVMRKQLFLITHEIFLGNPSHADDPVWSELDEFLARTWIKQDKMPLRIFRCAIDAHYLTNAVAHYARSRKQIIPVTGVENNWTADVMPPKPLDIKRNGKYYRTGKVRWPLGVSLLKMDLYGRLKLTDPTASEFIHFPSGMANEYYKQLTGEVCKLVENSRGEAKTVWEKSYDAVEALDCAIYVLALYKILGMHLWTEEKWQRAPLAQG